MGHMLFHPWVFSRPVADMNDPHQWDDDSNELSNRNEWACSIWSCQTGEGGGVEHHDEDEEEDDLEEDDGDELWWNDNNSILTLLSACFSHSSFIFECDLLLFEGTAVEPTVNIEKYSNKYM